MSIERASGDSSLIDVLDRVLDKGIVIDAWVRLSLSLASTSTWLRSSERGAIFDVPETTESRSGCC